MTREHPIGDSRLLDILMTEPLPFHILCNGLANMNELSTTSVAKADVHCETTGTMSCFVYHTVNALLDGRGDLKKKPRDDDYKWGEGSQSV